MKEPGELTLPLVERWIDEVVTVSDDEVAEAMVLLLERSKLVVEGAGAVAVAALMQGKVKPASDGTVVAVLSGGNVDASLLAECIRLGETSAGRRIVIFTIVPDRPGALAGLLRVVADHGANVVEVTHLREGMDLHVRETAVQLVLQTSGPEHDAEIVDADTGRGLRAAGRALERRLEERRLAPAPSQHRGSQPGEAADEGQRDGDPEHPQGDPERDHE